jgi:hypothetical protein
VKPIRMLVVASGVLVFALVGVGCGEKPPAFTEVSEAPSNLAAEPTIATEVFDPFGLKWGDAIGLGDLDVTVEAPIDDTANLDRTERLFLTEGAKLISCLVTIKNNGSEPYEYNMMCFTMQDAKGFTYDPFGVTSQPMLSSGSVLPGRVVKGAIGFELVEGAVPAFLSFQREVFGEAAASWGD